jgi:hypothetical protein
MLQRCGNKNNGAWEEYGGRGIKVCERWWKFENFYADMGPPSEGLTLDRIDVNGDYEPMNCRWADWYVQAANRRNTRFVTVNGERMCISNAVQMLRRLAKESSQADIGVRIEVAK